MAQQDGLDVIDLLPTYSRYPPSQVQLRPGDTWHPNAEGHRIIAAALDRYIRTD
jgi:hypothetical protein